MWCTGESASTILLFLQSMITGSPKTFHRREGGVGLGGIFGTCRGDGIALGEGDGDGLGEGDTVGVGDAGGSCKLSKSRYCPLVSWPRLCRPSMPSAAANENIAIRPQIASSGATRASLFFIFRLLPYPKSARFREASLTVIDKRKRQYFGTVLSGFCTGFVVRLPTYPVVGYKNEPVNSHLAIGIDPLLQLGSLLFPKS